MLFWGEFDSSFTFFCMQLSIMIFWIEFDLIFAFFYILHRGDLHCLLYIVLDFISIFFCMQVFWTVLDLIFTFFCMQVIHMLFWRKFDSSFTFFCMQLSIDPLSRPCSACRWSPWCSGLCWT